VKCKKDESQQQLVETWCEFKQSVVDDATVKITQKENVKNTESRSVFAVFV